MSDSTTNDPGPTVQPEPGKSQISPEAKATWTRLFPMIVVAILMGLAQSVLNLMALIQFIVMLTGKGRPNTQIADFGKGLGAWQGKSARYLTAESEEKPWPWAPLS